MNFKELKQNADKGILDSMNELARCYALGIETDVDYNAAFTYYQRAAELGSALAMTNLAIFYSQGVTGERNIQKALDLFHNAACLGELIREYVFRYIEINELREHAMKGFSSAEYFYALTLGDNEKEKREALLISASNKHSALSTAALAVKSFLANPSANNAEAKRLFLQAIDEGYDYYQLLHQLTLTEQQLKITNKVRICDTVREFLGARYERPFILVRITGREWAEKFLNNGEIFTRSLEYYRASKTPGVGDINEGIESTGITQWWNELEEESVYELNECGIYDEYITHERVFCLYCMEYTKGAFVRPDIRMRQFGDTAVVIWDGLEFCKRFHLALCRKYGDSIWFGHRRVNYDVIFSEARKYTEFSKTESYAWQNEYRFVIDIANGRLEQKLWNPKQKDREQNEATEDSAKEEPNIFDLVEGLTDFAKLMYLSSGGKTDLFEDNGSDLISIGDISDICDMYSIEEFMNLSSTITEKAAPYRIDDSVSEEQRKKAYALRPFIHL